MANLLFNILQGAAMAVFIALGFIVGMMPAVLVVYIALKLAGV